MCNALTEENKVQSKFMKMTLCTLYSDAFCASIESTRKNLKTQGFVNNDLFFVYYFLMASKAKAPQGLVAYIHKIGIPAKVHTDN
jgi:hypothetical protein